MKYVKNNESALCYVCKGKCCKTYGGAFHPEDIGEEITKDSLKKFIDRGDVSIDWLEGSPKVYFLRMRHVDAPIVDPLWGAQCVHLTETGCDLKFEERAYGCKTLVPAMDLCCYDGAYTKELAAEDWEPYQNILKELCAEYDDPKSHMSYLDSMLDFILGRFDED